MYLIPKDLFLFIYCYFISFSLILDNEWLLWNSYISILLVTQSSHIDKMINPATTHCVSVQESRTKHNLVVDNDSFQYLNGNWYAQEKCFCVSWYSKRIFHDGISEILINRYCKKLQWSFDTIEYLLQNAENGPK